MVGRREEVRAEQRARLHMRGMGTSTQKGRLVHAFSDRQLAVRVLSPARDQARALAGCGGSARSSQQTAPAP